MAQRVLSAILALSLVAILVTPAVAQDSIPVQTHVVWLTSTNDSGVNGVAWIYPLVDSSQVVVTMFVWGLEPDSAHSNHFHRGSCDSGPIAYDLTDLVANADGYATATTLVNVPFGALFAEPHHLKAHAGILGTSPAAAPSITCGNIEGMAM